MSTNPSAATDAQLEKVFEERTRQICLKLAGKFKYGCEDDELDDFKCYSILGEEFGEVGHEVNESINRPVDLQKLHDELIQVAAVAVAWSERVKRQIDVATMLEMGDFGESP